MALTKRKFQNDPLPKKDRFPFIRTGYSPVLAPRTRPVSTTALLQDRLIVVSGMVGSGKTRFIRQIKQVLETERKVTISKSYAIEKDKTKLSTYIAALFYDLSPEKQVQIPKQIEKRERELRELVCKNRSPVALFNDEAHELNGNT